MELYLLVISNKECEVAVLQLPNGEEVDVVVTRGARWVSLSWF